MGHIGHAVVIAMIGLAAPLRAQGADQPPVPVPVPAIGPTLDDALGLAQGAIAACRATGDHVVALVVDAAGQPVVLLSDDGAVSMAQAFAPRKTAIVIRYKASSAAIAERAKTDGALAAEIKADPKTGFALAGALPILVDNVQIGALAVSGGSSPAGDEACARAAIAKTAIRKR